VVQKAVTLGSVPANMNSGGDLVNGDQSVGSEGGKFVDSVCGRDRDGGRPGPCNSPRTDDFNFAVKRVPP